ncbi:MAG: hypothetical protein LBV72_10785 [Tannerella sp.]|jgi:hypothetical protein|nr:hypothetical protein [Tannerella sp.]
MARINENLFVLGASGMVGKQMVYRNCKGGIILQKRPRRTQKQTDAQIAQVNRFKEAVIYAKAALADEATRKAYSEKARNSAYALSAHNVAVGDYLNAPIINKVNLERYSGLAGEEIVISAIDDFEVKEVAVEIRQSDNTLVEKGKALANGNGLDWIYTTQWVNTMVAGSIITACAVDRPGNITKEEVII